MKTLIESEIPLLINIYLKYGENKFYTSLRVKLNIFTFELFSPKMYTGVFYLAGGHLSSGKNKKISIIILSFKFLKRVSHSALFHTFSLYTSRYDALRVYSTSALLSISSKRYWKDLRNNYHN